MFGRRNRPPLYKRIAGWLWPQGGLKRWMRYVWHRVSRIQDTPHRVAIGVACGALASFTPYMGFHFILAGVLAWLVGGSLLASAFGTAVGNPFTFPFIWLASFNLGNVVLGRGTVEKLPVHPSFEVLMHRPMELLGPLLLPMTIGGIVLGTAAAALLYWPVRYVVGVYQVRRRAKLEARRRALLSTRAHPGE